MQDLLSEQKSQLTEFHPTNSCLRLTIFLLTKKKLKQRKQLAGMESTAPENVLLLSQLELVLVHGLGILL